MKPVQLSTSFRSALFAAATLLTAALSLSAPARAQNQAGQVVCFSFEGNGKLSGKDNLDQPSRTGVRVGGKSFFFGAAGNSTGQLADALLAALQNAGYTATKVGSNVVCVSAGPNGVPLTTGGGIGTTDTGLEGIDCEVQKPPVKPAQKPPKKTLKTQGVTLPLPKPGTRVAQDQKLQFQVDVWRIINGNPVLVRVQFSVQLTIGMNADQVRRAIEQALRQAGIRPSMVVYDSPVLNAKIPSLSLEYLLGDPIQHIVFWQPPQLDLFPIDITAGSTPSLAGGATYGEPSGQLVQTQRVQLDLSGFPAIGQPFQPIVLGPPSGQVFVGVGARPGEMPFLGGDLLVDPTAIFVLPPFPLDPLGTGGLNLPIPPDPKLAGLELALQGVVVDPKSNAVGLTNGLSVKIGQ